MKEAEVHELLYQALETEIGGVQIYETALRCARDDNLRKEWEEYHEQTTRHVELVEGVLGAFGLDPQTETPGRGVIRHIGSSLVEAMEMALEEGSPDEAEIVAGECVTLAETKDHLNWELLQEVASHATGEKKKALRAACDEVMEQENEHLYHTQGWTRELWVQALGMKAVLPPPEEQKNVKTATGAERAKHARTSLA
jgi:rubrerythrin